MPAAGRQLGAEEAGVFKGRPRLLHREGHQPTAANFTFGTARETVLADESDELSSDGVSVLLDRKIERLILYSGGRIRLLEAQRDAEPVHRIVTLFDELGLKSTVRLVGKEPQ